MPDGKKIFPGKDSQWRPLPCGCVEIYVLDENGHWVLNGIKKKTGCAEH